MQFNESITTPPLISILHREHAKYLNEKVKKENLSYGLQPMLVTIYKNEGIIQEQLAKYYNLNESTITRNLKKLEEKGLIERIPEKRTKRLKVTSKGEKIAERVMDYDEKWDVKLKEFLTKEEYDNLKNTLLKICEVLV
ncbi:MAG: MarR family transcriptional regulator [Methanobrevibacter sp.]|nr:MarR family transcriptional regulator [Methanobrevibacter sp.]